MFRKYRRFSAIILNDYLTDYLSGNRSRVSGLLEFVMVKCSNSLKAWELEDNSVRGSRSKCSSGYHNDLIGL